MKKTVLLLISAFLIIRCESAGTGEPIVIPNVDVDCTTAKCKAVPSNDYELTVSMTGSGCAQDQIELDPVISGTANASCVNGVGCRGTVSTWRNVNSTTVTTVPSSTYSVCGWIDLDAGGPNPNDAFANENLLVTSATITLTDWGATYFIPRKRLYNH